MKHGIKLIPVSPEAGCNLYEVQDAETLEAIPGIPLAIRSNDERLIEAVEVVINAVIRECSGRDAFLEG